MNAPFRPSVRDDIRERQRCGGRLQPLDDQWCGVSHDRRASDDIHPIHFHRHSFEVTSLAGKPTAGVLKDVMMLGGYQEAEVDFVADNPGMTLFHCHQQLHMDFGFMTLFDYE